MDTTKKAFKFIIFYVHVYLKRGTVYLKRGIPSAAILESYGTYLMEISKHGKTQGGIHHPTSVPFCVYGGLSVFSKCTCTSVG